MPRPLALALLLASALPAAAASVPLRVPPATDAAPRLTRDFVGLSFEANELSTGLFDAADAPLVRLFREVGAGLLRIGGNSVDRTPWDDSGDADGQGLTKGVVAPSDVDRLAGFLGAVPGWRALYSLDLAAGDGAAMAREARYAASALGRSLFAVAIGNEPDLYSRHGTRPTSFSYADYAAEWSQDRQLIAGAAPRVPVSGPDASYDAKRYTLPFMAAFGPGLRVATQHYYKASSCSGPTVASLLAPDPVLTTTATTLAAAATAGVRDGLRYDEINSYYTCTDSSGHSVSGVAGVSDSFASALWAIDITAQLAAAGISGVDFHSGGHAFYSPIQTANGAVIAVKPEFYGLWLFARALRDCPCRIAASARDLGGRAGLNAYALQREGGGTAVLLLNEGAGEAAVDLSGLPAGTLGRLTLRAADGLADTDPTHVTVNGASLGTDGRWSGPVVPEPVPAPSGAARIAVPPGAVVLVAAR